MPPSVWDLYVGTGKYRHKSPEYSAWMKASGFEMLPIKPVLGTYELDIHVPKKMRGDLDNRAKGIIDLLVEMGATEDDKNMQKFTMMKSTESGVIIEVMSVLSEREVRG